MSCSDALASWRLCKEVVILSSFFKSNTGNTEGERSGKLRILIIVGCALLGIFLLLYGGGAFHAEEDPKTESATYSVTEDELIRYQEHLEARIRTLCESVAGVADVRVFVSLESGYQSVYATEETESGEEYVILGSGSSATALLLGRESPQISGIGIVCSGGGNATVKQELTSLLCATFRISSNRVYVADTGR